MIFGALAIVLAFRRWKSSRSGRPVWDRVKLKAPLKIGSIVHKIALARWSRTLSSLVTAGVPMLEAIDVTGQTAGNALVERAMVGVKRSPELGSAQCVLRRFEIRRNTMSGNLPGNAATVLRLQEVSRKKCKKMRVVARPYSL